MADNGGLQMLVVDDDPSFLEVMIPRLQRFLADCRITTANSGEHAIELMRAQPDGFDVALIDQVLSTGPDGTEVMQVLREICPSMPVIIMTGWGLEGGIEALRAGAYRYIAKGHDVEELAHMVRAAAEHRRLMRQSLLTRVLDISNALQSRLGLDDVLHIILTGIRDMGYDRVRLYLLSDNGASLVCRKQLGGTHDMVGLMLPLDEDECSRETLASAKPHIYRAGANRRLLYVDVLERGDVEEWADIPLIAHGRPIGKISADNKYSRRRLLDAELEPLTVLANQAANAIYNAQVYEKTQAALANLQRIHQAGVRIAASLDLDETLQLIITNAVAATQGSAGSLSLIDSAGREERRATFNFSDAMKERTRVRPDGYSRRAMASGQVIAMPDVANVPDVNPGIVASGFRANICLPLLFGERALGVMWVSYSQPRSFPAEEIELLQTFANQAAVAIEHARLHADLRRQVTQLDELNRIGQTLVSTLETGQTPWLLMEEVRRLLNLEAGSVMLVDGDEMVVRAAVGPAAERVQDQRIPIRFGIAGRAARTGRPQLVADVRQDPDFYPGVDDATGFVTRSLLAVPLVAKEKVVAVIEAVNKIAGDFSPEDIQLLLSLAPIASSALENARLYADAQRSAADLKRRAENLAAVQRVCTEISALLGRQELLDLMCRRVVELFTVDHSGLVLFDDDHAYGTVAAEYPKLGDQRGALPLRGVPIEESLIQTQTPQFVADVASDPRLGPVRERLLRLNIRSLLIVPLVLTGRVIGSFSLDAVGQPRQFSNEIIDLCRIIAAQAALAIENARLFNSEQACTLRWRRVANASTEVTQMLSRPPRELLTTIAQTACRIVGADCAVIYPYDAATRRLDPRNIASFNLRQPDYPVTEKVRGAGSWVSRIVREGLVKVNDLEREETEIAPKMRFFTDEGVRAFVGVRLGTPDEPVGLLYINFRKPHKWLDDEIEAIQPYAAQAALAIKHALFQGQLLERTQKNEQRLATVVELSRQFGSSLEIDTVIDSLLSSLAKPFPQAHSRVVEFYDAKSGEMTIHPAAYRYYWNRRKAPRVRRPIQDDRSISGWVATHRTSANVPDVRQDPRHSKIVDDARSQLTVPIEFADQLIGVLTLESRDIAAFDDEDVQLLEALADQAGVAIQNARTFERLKETDLNLRTRTAMLWTSKAGFIWFHRIRGAAGAIRDWALLAREKLRESGQLELVADEIKEIEEEAADIVERVPSRMLLPGEERLASVRVNDLLRRIVKDIKERQGGLKAVVNLRLQLPDTVVVEADNLWLAEAISIVIHDALREMGAGGRLTIISAERARRVEIRIRDTGAGIPPTVLTKLFREPIAPADGARGSGQGLLWTKTILEGYGGDIRVEKTGSRGTTFLITLPMGVEQPAGSLPPNRSNR